MSSSAIRLPEPWREALAELARRKLRTGLTLLGLIFGVGAIVAMLAVGEGSRREALRLVEGLGLTNLIANAERANEEQLRERRARSLGLSRADAAAALEAIPGARRYAIEKEIKAYQLLGPGGPKELKASAVSHEYFDISSLRIAAGRGFTEDDERGLAAVAILGHQAARTLFPDGDAVGGAVKLNHQWLRVIGVLADRDLSRSEFEGVALGLESNRVFVPLESAAARLRFQPLEDEIDRLILQMHRPEQVFAGAKALGTLLDQRHGGVDDYRLVVPAQLFHQHQQTQRIFQVVMGAIAAVSLLVGGIGIMNIMLANVLERRREIGLLRAIGARQRDIVAQFMREAAVICGVGALAGMLFGILLAYLIAFGAGWQVAWAPIPILLATLACAGVGLVFGIYPARQAARLDPIAALRTD